MPDLTPVQRDVINEMRSRGADTLHRLPGGFWTIRGLLMNHARTPIWWAEARTVRALVQMGLMTFRDRTTARLTSANATERHV